jgi:hypothetical protein
LSASTSKDSDWQMFVGGCSGYLQTHDSDPVLLADAEVGLRCRKPGSRCSRSMLMILGGTRNGAVGIAAAIEPFH